MNLSLILTQLNSWWAVPVMNLTSLWRSNKPFVKKKGKASEQELEQVDEIESPKKKTLSKKREATEQVLE